MNVVRTIAALRDVVRARRPGSRVAFVPTMGALHEGHVALLRAGQRAGHELVASIFVNPKQFNDPADLARYPRPEAADLAVAQSNGVHTVFIPSAEEMYPPDAATTLHVAGAAEGFEGSHRPGHFNGVALVCLKLFSLVDPDVVLLGQKDAQQVAVLRQLVRDLDLDVTIEVVPTVRDVDGLALSSRNARLSPDERQRALAIPRALRAAIAARDDGSDPVDAARRELAAVSVDYVAVADFDGPTLVIAATVGTTRLIDNVPLNAPERAGLEQGNRVSSARARNPVS